MSLNFRPETSKTAENTLVCSLLESKSLYLFACTVLFKILQKAKRVGMKKKTLISILTANIEKRSENKFLQKPGYDCTAHPSLCSKLLDTSTYKEFVALNTQHSISFLTLMGAFYKFQDNNEFAKLCIDYDTALQKKFMITMQDYFSLPPTMSYSTLTSIIDTSEGYWFYLFVLTYMSSTKKNFVRHNILNVSEYIRTRVVPTKGTRRRYVSRSLQRTLTCKRRQLNTYPATKVIRGNSYQKPTKNGIWTNLMKYYKKEAIAGPSGSSINTYQIVFQIAKVLPETKTNKINLLLCILADYYSYYHSFSEVLQEYVSEAGLPHYDLSMNDVEYIKRVQKQVHV